MQHGGVLGAGGPGPHARPDGPMSYGQQLAAYGGLDAGLYGEEDDVHLREAHASFRTGAGQRLQRAHTAGRPHGPAPGHGAGPCGPLASKKGRRRWLEDDTDDSLGGGDGFIPAGRPEIAAFGVGGSGGANTGHIVRMKRGEAWSKFLAYEGCCQVCMREGAKGVPEAAYFLGSGCEPLRAGLGIGGLLLPQVLAAHLANAVDAGSLAIDLGNEIHWDDYDADDRRLNAAAFMNHMSVMKVRVARLELPQPGMNVLSRLVCRNADYSHITVHLKLVPGEGARVSASVPYRLRKDGATLPGSPVFDLQPDHVHHEALLEIVQGGQVLARGKVSAKRLWQVGMELSSGPEDDEWEDGYDDASDIGGSMGQQGGGGGGVQSRSICAWFKGEQASVPLGRGTAGLWVSVFDSGASPGKVLLVVQRTQRELPGMEVPREDGPGRATLKVSSCQAYDFVLLAALRSQGCSESRLEVGGEWAWLLQAFAGLYGVRSSYATMSHLRWVLRPGVASVSQGCFDLLARKLQPLLEQEAAGGNSLTQLEATMLGQIKCDTEELLKLAFENYYLLSSGARKGILDGASSPPPGHVPEFPPAALVAGVHLFETMRDVFHPSDVEWLGDRFRLAAKGRWARLATLCDEGGAPDSPSPLMTGAAPLRHNRSQQQGSPASKASPLYAKMIRVAAAIQQDLEYDRRLQEVPRLLPSSLNLPGITAAEYCCNYVVQLRAVLAQCPPNQPTDVAIDMLAAVAQLQRYLEEHSLAVPRGQPGCIDTLELFGPHVRSWITNSQEALCATCRTLEATTELSSLAAGAPTSAAPPLGGSEEGGVAPICQEMLRALVAEMGRYERVISHWPLFGPYLEAALCVVLRAVVAAISRQCGMMRVRGGGCIGLDGPYGRQGGGGGSGGSPFGRGGAQRGAARYSPAPDAFRPGSRAHGSPTAVHHGSPRAGGAPAMPGSPAPGLSAQWAWANADSPSPPRGRGGGGGNGASGPRVLLMVREAVLLNSLKRLMVAAPIYEATINKWSGGAAAPPGGPAGESEVGYEDVAPVVGAQFAQVVKELRTEYSSAVASTCQRMAAALAACPATSLFCLLSQAKAASAQAGNAMSAMQQAAMVEGLSGGLFGCLSELLGNLAAALDSRVFVAMGRGLWDFVGRDMLKFVENLQEGKDNKGAWRTRQNASLLLDHINTFFRSSLVAAMEHVLQERDLAVPLHIDATQKLLAGNTTALNMNFTPF